MASISENRQPTNTVLNSRLVVCLSTCERAQEAATNAASALDGVKADMQRRVGALEEELRDNKSNRDADLQIIEKALTIAHSNQEKVCAYLGILQLKQTLTALSTYGLKRPTPPPKSNSLR